MNGVNNWMNEIDVFLTSEEAAIGDAETLQAQLTESEVLRRTQLVFRREQPRHKFFLLIFAFLLNLSVLFTYVSIQHGGMVS